MPNKFLREQKVMIHHTKNVCEVSLHSYSHSAYVYACLDYFVNFQRDILHEAVETRITLPASRTSFSILQIFAAQMFLFSFTNLLHVCDFFLPMLLTKIKSMYVIQHCFICRPQRFPCVGGCWEQSQDCCYFGIGRQTL
jgi:hypothetical protein